MGQAVVKREMHQKYCIKLSLTPGHGTPTGTHWYQLKVGKNISTSILMKTSI
jgi:hypothetical protein